MKPDASGRLPVDDRKQRSEHPGLLLIEFRLAMEAAGQRTVWCNADRVVLGGGVDLLGVLVSDQGLWALRLM
jgi:hypothetical protein